VKFVFCTTEPEKLPITILSRCQRFDFVMVDAPAIGRRLAQIVEAEGGEVSAAALELIARRAAGSMRDSQSLLEQLLGSATGPIGVDEVHAVIGTGSEERIGELLAAVAARDAAGAIAALDAALAGGADPGGVMEQLLAALRDCLLASVGCPAEMLAGSSGLGQDVAATGRGLGTANVLAMLQILDQALGRMRVSGHAAVLAEMAVVRLATLEDLESLAAAVERVATAGPGQPPREKKTPELTRQPPAARPTPAPVQAPTPAPTPTVAPPSGNAPAGNGAAPVAELVQSVADRVEAARRPLEEPPESERPPAAPARAEASLGDAATLWREVTESLGGLAADFAATATGVAWRDGVLEVMLAAEAATAASFLRRPDSTAALKAGLEARVGQPVRHAIVVAPPRPQGTEAERPPQPAVASQAALVRAATEHPLVAHARTLFDAAIRKVEPLRPRTVAAVGAAVAPGGAATAAGDEGVPHAEEAEEEDG